MSIRVCATATLALAMLGSGLLWVLSDRDSQKMEDSGAVSSSGETSGGGSPAPHTTQALVIVEGNSSKSDAKDGARNDGASAPVVWSARTLEFAEQPDSDPSLSKELEYWIQRAIEAEMGRGRYEVHSVTCRGNNCQIVSLDRALPTDPGWDAFVSTMLRQLGYAYIQDPSTGVQLRPKLRMMHRDRERIRYVTVVGFDKVVNSSE